MGSFGAITEKKEKRKKKGHPVQSHGDKQREDHQTDMRKMGK